MNSDSAMARIQQGEDDPYGQILAYLGEVGRLQQVEDPESYAAGFQLIVHVLLARYLDRKIRALAMAAYDAGLAAGFYGESTAIAAGLNATAEGPVSRASRAFLERVRGAGCTHGHAIRQGARVESGGASEWRA
ncbi:hypothetical protein WI87_14010 [Burkholderia ubonensis]|uniref:hypothetical protein n=1 Tax=Burkholderia ubonensis TaxID=101571 RepID=UPI0007558A7F|nr:hypothetical protein [Burkholderia ubonensis]KVD59168.1 hypothetical protein WI87_14010 [Burkholderia ubonensis]